MNNKVQDHDRHQQSSGLTRLCVLSTKQGCMSNVFAKACRICLACRRTTFPLPCLIGVLVFSKATWHRSCMFVDLLVSFAPCLTVGCILQGLILTGILLSTNSYMCVHPKLLRIDVRYVKTTHGTVCNLQQSRPPRCCGLTWHQLFLKVVCMYVCMYVCM